METMETSSSFASFSSNDDAKSTRTLKETFEVKLDDTSNERITPILKRIAANEQTNKQLLRAFLGKPSSRRNKKRMKQSRMESDKVGILPVIDEEREGIVEDEVHDDNDEREGIVDHKEEDDERADYHFFDQVESDEWSEMATRSMTFFGAWSEEKEAPDEAESQAFDNDSTIMSTLMTHTIPIQEENEEEEKEETVEEETIDERDDNEDDDQETRRSNKELLTECIGARPSRRHASVRSKSRSSQRSSRKSSSSSLRTSCTTSSVKSASMKEDASQASAIDENKDNDDKTATINDEISYIDAVEVEEIVKVSETRDDVEDEDAYKKLGPQDALTQCIGMRPSRSGYSMTKPDSFQRGRPKKSMYRSIDDHMEKHHRRISDFPISLFTCAVPGFPSDPRIENGDDSSPAAATKLKRGKSRSYQRVRSDQGPFVTLDDAYHFFDWIEDIDTFDRIGDVDTFDDAYDSVYGYEEESIGSMTGNSNVAE